MALGAHAQFGPLQTLTNWPDGPDLHAVDVDGDGDVDLAGAFGQEWKWFANNGDGSFAAFAALVDCGTPDPMGGTFADMNGDMLPDLLWWQGHQVFAAMNLGGGSFAEPAEVATSGGLAISAMGVADLSGDEFPDIVLTCGDEAIARVVWCRNVGGTFEAPAILPFPIASPAPTHVLVADFNQQEGNDIVLFHHDGMVTAIHNAASNGTNWIPDTLCYATMPPFGRPQAIDVDGDGDLDIAEAAVSGIQWAENRINTSPPFESFTLHQLEPFTSAGRGWFGRIGCEGVSVVYVPANPQLPVRWRSFLPAINGFAPAQELNGVPRGQHLRMADLNADGREDLFLATGAGLRWAASQTVGTTAQVELPDFDTFCRTGPALELPDAIPTNGQWSGTWVDGSLFHRANAPAGEIALAYTFYEEDNCPVGGLATVTLIDGPLITPVLDPVLCSGSGPFAMASEPQNTQWMGLSEGNMLDLATYGGGLIACSYEDPSGMACASFIGPFQVWNTVSTDIQPAGPFCVTDGMQEILPVEDLPNSNWGGNISGTSAAGAWFDPAQGAGTYTVILQRNPAHPQQCAGADTLTIVVSDLIPEVTVLPFPAHCSSQPVQLSGASPAGGSWSGNGVTGSTMDPAITGPGTHGVTYSYTAPEGCSNTAIMEVTFIEAATVTSDAQDLLFCNTDSPVQFHAEPAGGTWAAPLAADGMLDPHGLSQGDHAVVYTWTDPAGCTVTNAPLNISVLPTTEVFILEPGPFCLDGGSQLIFGSHHGVWSGSVSGTGDHVLIDPALLGPGTWPITLTASDAGACPGTATIEIMISPCLGTNGPDAPSTLQAMPNPFSDELLLLTDTDGTLRVDILDATGRLVRSSLLTGHGTHRLALDDMPDGTYLLRVEHGGAIRSLRVVKAGL
jgi:hypothetical protein